MARMCCRCTVEPRRVLFTLALFFCLTPPSNRSGELPDALQMGGEYYHLLTAEFIPVILFSPLQIQGPRLASRETRRTTAIKRFFFRPLNMIYPLWVARVGGRNPCRSLFRYANLHVSAHPIGVGRAEKLKPLTRRTPCPNLSANPFPNPSSHRSY
jgi:hypothetical protein